MKLLLANQTNELSIGCLFKRTNFKPDVKDLLQELHVYQLEADIMLQAIQHIIDKKLLHFDSHSCDWKCQTRASIIIDLLTEKTFIQQELHQEKILILNFSNTINELLKKINSYTPAQLQQFSKNLQKSSLLEFLDTHQINYTPPSKLQLAGLLLFCALSKNQLLNLTNNTVSPKKINKLVNRAKQNLSQQSIAHEQDLAQHIGAITLIRVLQQVEFFNICSMTSFFPSFKIIFEKMKQKQQQFLQKNIIFCLCGGIQTEQNQLFAPEQGKFVLKQEKIDNDTVVMVIKGYQYPGTFEQLKETLGVAKDTTFIPLEYYKPCICGAIINQSFPDNIENAILAVFAQHPQFINHAPIDWEGLGSNKF